MQIDLLSPLRILESIIRRGVARAVSNGIRDGVADGFQDALSLTLDVEPSELPALESPPQPAPAPIADKPARPRRRTAKKKATLRTKK